MFNQIGADQSAAKSSIMGPAPSRREFKAPCAAPVDGGSYQQHLAIRQY